MDLFTEPDAGLAPLPDDGHPRPRITGYDGVTGWWPGALALVTEGRRLHDALSSRPLADLSDQVVPRELEAYLALVYEAAGQPQHSPRPATTPTVPYCEPLEQTGEVLILFSGGKDSVAAALKAERNGWTPVLYHLAGLNRGSGDELGYARALAEHRGWELIVDRVSVSGAKTGFIEMPAKNQVISALAVARILERGGRPALYAGGWHTHGEEQDQRDVGYDFSDGFVSLGRWADYMEARVPGLGYWTPLYDEVEAWSWVAGAGLLGWVKGCACPPRYKKRVRETNQRKFGRLLPGRCGSCVKCAWEQVALERLGIVEPNPALRKHGERWLLEHYDHRAGHSGGLAAIEDFLVSPVQVERRRRRWPVQTDPYDFGLAQPVDIATRQEAS